MCLALTRHGVRGVVLSMYVTHSAVGISSSGTSVWSEVPLKIFSLRFRSHTARFTSPLASRSAKRIRFEEVWIV